MRQTFSHFSKLVLIASAFIFAFPLDAKVHEFKLDNGMKLLVKEDHRAPVVVSQIWYKVGASDEYGGVTGVSHVLEHMMFKGTKRHPAGEFSRIIAENGGRENAFTGRDYTAYFQQLEKSRLKVSFEMEADRMRNLTLPEDEFAKELKVVQEERRLRTDDNPQALTYEQFYATAFASSPYHQPIIGWMTDLESLTVADLRHWYQRFYAPNNATLVVVGDVQADDVHKLAKEHFGDIEPTKLQGSKPRKEFAQKGMRRIEVKAAAQLPQLLMGYKVPVIGQADEPWEPYALEVLAGVLDGGNASRLPRQLVRKQQLAASVGAGYNSVARYNELFMVQATPTAGKSVARVQKAIEKQLSRVKKTLVSSTELRRIKAQVLAAKVYQQDSIFYQAMELGMLETVGLGWQLSEQYEKHITSVTAEQVRAVARKYLVEEGLTIAQLVPVKANGEVRDAN
ncbi:MAG: insulinase family protein [Gammaproteobacteria bacterium]|nr:insulinase family protein [Gammaproteobacteria bacterium]